MAKRVIQVPMDERLLEELDRMAKKAGLSRAELIRKACRRELKEIERRELDRSYAEGYRRKPEGSEWGELGAALLGKRHEKESW